MCSRAVTDFVYERVEMLSQPEIALERVRQAGDVAWSEPMRRWIVVSRQAALEALNNPAFRVYDLFRVIDGVQARIGVDLSALQRICGWIPFLVEDARHAALREVFARILSEIRSPYLVTFADVSRELLEALARQGGGDLARDYADLLHVEVVGRLIGLPAADRLWIARASSSQGSIDFAASVSEMIDASGRAQALLTRLEGVTAGLPFMDRIGLHLRTAGIADTAAHRIECLIGLLMLGRDTIGGTLTLGLAHLLDAAGGHMNPADLGEGAAIADEVIRLSSTVQIAIRTAASDKILAGQAIARGEMLMIFLPAANRDPLAFRCPHSIESQHPTHTAFGAGRHLCVGRPLSRQIVAMALDHLKRFEYIASSAGRRFDESRNTRKYLNFPVTMRAA